MRPIWLVYAEGFLGQREVPGPGASAWIRSMWLGLRGGSWFWTSIGKADDSKVPWCFTGETEIMTRAGWTRFDALGDEPVYQVSEDGTLSLTKPLSKIVKPYDGDVFDIHHRSIRMTCDVGHRWWGRWGKEGGSKFGTLDQIGSNGLSIDSVHAGSGANDFTDAQLTMLAAFLSDGKFRAANGVPRYVEFEVSKARKIEAIRVLQPKHEYIQRKVYGPLTRTPLTVFQFDFPAYFKLVFDDYKQLSRGFINSLSAEQAKFFLNAYAIFDGNGRADSKVVLYSSNVQLRDDLVTIAVMAGYHPSLQENTSPLSGKSCWRICFSPNKPARMIRKKHITRRRFEGTLYCVQVPEGRIVVRGPDSAPVVTGNCGAFVAHCLQNCHMEYAQRYASARAWLEWGTTLTGPAVGAVVVFAREGGGHVGFVHGRDTKGRLLVCGGNQGDAVTIAPFDLARVAGYRWPEDVALQPLVGLDTLPMYAAAGAASVNEA